MNKISASYKDNTAFIFTHHQKIYRCILQNGKDHYDQLMNSGLYEHLTTQKLLIAHTEVNNILSDKLPEQYYKIIEPTYIPFISYPYEWSVTTLKQAAILTLQVNIEALQYRMILKDATPLNIQFYKGNLTFIDTTSFEKYNEGEPWIAYRQFCESFLLPLLLLKYYPSTYPGSWYGTADHITLEEYAPVLPFKSRFNMAALLHIHLQNNHHPQNKSTKNRQIKKQQLINLLLGLKNNIEKINTLSTGKNWSHYYQKDHSENYYIEKEKIVTSFLQTIPDLYTGWDIGCNTGNFSYLLSNYCNLTIASDTDAACVNILQEKVMADEKNIIPLIIDYCNLSPGTGWDNRERLALMDRMSKIDVILFLALAHHIVLSNNVPLPLLSKSLSEQCRFLVIEFCTTEDEKVKEIIARKKSHHEWNVAYFEQCFAAYFIQLKQVEVVPNKRILYLFKNKIC